MTNSSLLLVVNGLDLPVQALRDLAFDLPTPGLDALLADARVTREAPPDAAPGDLLAAALWPRRLTAVGACRRLGYGAAVADGEWLCLDPVRLVLGERTARLAALPEAALNADEVAALAADLAPVLAPLGQLETTTPARWHLRLAENVTAPRLPPPAAGIDAAALLALAAPWRGLLTDVQMLLHAHPVNAARRAAGRPDIHALWPWGTGALATATASSALRLFADEPALCGFARHRGHAVAAPPRRFAALAGADAVVVLDAMAAAAVAQDATGWRQALATLDDAWFAPVAAALRAGTLHAVDLAMPGTERLTRAATRRSDPLRRAWRALSRRAPPRAIERLGSP